jgi:hypothetical protein
VFRIKLRALPSLSEPTGRKNRLPPRKQTRSFFFRENQNDAPTHRRSLLFSDKNAFTGREEVLRRVAPREVVP